MDPLKSIFWNQGLFLKPQHFQHLSLQTLAQSYAFTKITTGVEQGIASLSINSSALEAGLFQIETFEAILPDKTLLVFPGNCSIAPLSIANMSADKDSTIDIYLAVAPVLIDENNVSNNVNEQVRYIHNEPATVVDMYDFEEQTQLNTVNIKCRLITEKELEHHKESICIQIAKLFSQAGKFTLSSDFIPSIITIASSLVLQTNIQSLKQSLMARYEQLESFSSLKGQQSSDISSASLSTIMALNVLANAIPQLAHFEECLHLKTEQLYLCLRQLIGQLSLFSRTISVLGYSTQVSESLLPFNHENQTECFHRAFSLTRLLLNELTIEPEMLIHFIAQNEAKFVATLTADFLAKNNRYYFRLRSKENLELRVSDILQFAKLGADGQVDVYIKRALPGIKLSYLSRKPLGVASSPNSYYFSFDTTSFEWHKALESGRLGLIWPDAPEDLQVEIIAVRG
ncbi:type VI secretion system baseplate subunit TssK [Pseudoalteromonas tunicata]|uniref:type VI secretion system baseplate subunit TssK n=1 Tax=Pseudoalteromonas tunicata TaxID=314281 RepID=UPI00273D99C3|nr:type VI secretion system baseplate subunit TssK [Pseudoalteromonas tunicata]MDP4984273.1 type VI secretion system baseplate subunit TssK [Pseudoalteromonas tunicata]